MPKAVKKFLTVCAVLFLSLNMIFAQTSGVTGKGKIVIVVLDISGSIKNQFSDITRIIDKAVVKDRLDIGDYFVLIPFGDAALPMYSGQLLREEDKNSISNALKAMKADNDFTDIGSAIKTALNYIVDLKGDDYNLYEPLVLFITDGDITTPASSAFHGQNVDKIFEDSVIGNTYLYNGWYYVGIGRNLHDLPLIAEKSGREDFLLRIEDLNQLEFMLDDWISKIPTSQPIEQGEILLDNFRLQSHRLSKKKATKVVSTAKEIAFDILNTYKRTPISVEFKDARATFQTNDRKTTVPITLTPETGIIQIPNMRSKQTVCGFLPKSEIQGKGILKIQVVVSANGIDNQFDKAFNIDGKSASELLFSKIFWPLLVLAVIILVIVGVILIKKFMPLKITMEVIGKHGDKIRPVAMKIKKRVEFGSKAGLTFKLDSEMFAPVVGQIQRTGPNVYQIIPRDSNAFEKGSKKIDYILGTALKLKTKDDAIVSIKFKKVKK